MRSLIVAVALMGCYVPPAVSPPNPDAIPDAKTHRPLVTDHLPYRLEREKVRNWHLNNGWCARRKWPNTDEFYICTPEYLNWSTPPMYTLVRYDVDGGAIAYATFTPVPCRMYANCHGRSPFAWERDFVDHSVGLDEGLVERGRDRGDSSSELRSMPLLLIDALAAELHRRFGNPLWQDAHRFGSIWATPTSEVGLFITPGWVVETHEMRGGPPALTSR